MLELKRIQSKQDADYRELEKLHLEAIVELSQARVCSQYQICGYLNYTPSMHTQYIH